MEEPGRGDYRHVRPWRARKSRPLKAGSTDSARQEEDSVINTVEVGAPLRNKSRPGNSLAEHARAKQAFLGIDRIVENLSSILIRAGARKVEATVPVRTVQLVVDQKGMDEAFATLGNAVAKGAAVTIRGSLVRIETGEKEGDKGCALLSVSVTGGQAAMPGADAKVGVRDALSAVRRVIKKHSGFLRFWTRRGEIRLSLYLPVLH